jgi:hypothetical protein
VSVFVYLGPTLAAVEAERILPATYLAPAQQGDVLRAALRSPRAIGIIDGYFDHAPAVWHKEILWAIARGIPVFGAASMGALRAVELAPFGMVGVGRIFRDFHQGILEDDDEVAIAHLGETHDYRPVSEAMVNFRETLRRAVAADIASVTIADVLLGIAKSLYYPERTWPRVLAMARERSLGALEVQRLQDWLPNGRVNLKREDALDMLTAMRRLLDDGWKPDAPNFRFQPTNAWKAAVLQATKVA